MTAPGTGQINTAFWNLQNLFDAEPSAIAAELGISAMSGWNRRALEARVASLAAGIRTLFNGEAPDLIGLAEIENEKVASQLISAIGRDDYALVMADHPQTTAAGMAVLYSRDVFDEATVKSHGHLVHQRFLTCDILEVHLTVRANGCRLHTLVNHWPSRREPHADAFRRTVAAYCRRLVTQQLQMSRREFVELSETEVSRHQLTDRWNANVLLMGSFNDDPWSASLREILQADYRLQDVRVPLPLPQQGLPSWRSYAANQPELFNPAWSLLAEPDQTTLIDSEHHDRNGILDQMILSRGLVLGHAGLQAVCDARGVPRLQCLANESLTSSGGRPVPFSCDNYEGFSDRLPIGLSLRPASENVASDAAESVARTSAASPSATAQ